MQPGSYRKKTDFETGFRAPGPNGRSQSNLIFGAGYRVIPYLFTIAQIFNLPYRRFVIGKTLLAAGRWQVKNLRYSRLQVCATGAASTLTKIPVCQRK